MQKICGFHYSIDNFRPLTSNKIQKTNPSEYLEATFIFILEIKIQGLSNGSEEWGDRTTAGNIVQGTYGYAINLKNKTSNLRNLFFFWELNTQTDHRERKSCQNKYQVHEWIRLLPSQKQI